MRYSFDEADAQTTKKRQYYAMLGTRGIWQKGWKAVTVHGPTSGLGNFDADEWELYHVDEDRSEARNLAEQHPDKLKELIDLWFEEAGKYQVLPLDDRQTVRDPQRARAAGRAAADTYVYYPDSAEVPEAVAVNLRGRSFRILASIEITDPDAAGSSSPPAPASAATRSVPQGPQGLVRLQLPRRRRSRPSSPTDRWRPGPLRARASSSPSRAQGEHRETLRTRPSCGSTTRSVAERSNEDSGRHVHALRRRPVRGARLRRPGHGQVPEAVAPSRAGRSSTSKSVSATTSTSISRSTPRDARAGVSCGAMSRDEGLAAAAPQGDMCWIPGGTFAMGSEDFYPEERPVHRVAVDGFWMDEHPVTEAEFRRFVQATGYVTVRRAAARPGRLPRRRPRAPRARLARLPQHAPAP